MNSVNYGRLIKIIVYSFFSSEFIIGSVHATFQVSTFSDYESGLPG